MEQITENTPENGVTDTIDDLTYYPKYEKLGNIEWIPTIKYIKLVATEKLKGAELLLRTYMKFSPFFRWHYTHFSGNIGQRKHFNYLWDLKYLYHSKFNLAPERVNSCCICPTAFWSGTKLDRGTQEYLVHRKKLYSKMHNYIYNS